MGKVGQGESVTRADQPAESLQSKICTPQDVREPEGETESRRYPLRNRKPREFYGERAPCNGTGKTKMTSHLLVGRVVLSNSDTLFPLATALSLDC